MVKHLGGNVNPDSTFEKVPLNITEQQDWRNKFKNIASDIVSKTNDVLLKTLNELDQYTKRSKDLLDEEMAEMRRDLESLRPLHCDTVTLKSCKCSCYNENVASRDAYCF